MRVGQLSRDVELEILVVRYDGVAQFDHKTSLLPERLDQSINQSIGHLINQSTRTALSRAHTSDKTQQMDQDSAGGDRSFDVAGPPIWNRLPASGLVKT